MKLALLGADDESLALVRWAVDHGGHQFLSAFDSAHASKLRTIAPQVQLDESWESLVAGSSVDALIVGRGGAGLAGETGISDAERRADQLRKLVQAAVPLIVVCPACEAIVGFEIEMIRRDTNGVIVPFIPGVAHPAIARLAELASSGASSPIGAVEQITVEREQADRGRDAVLVQLARDAGLLRQLIGGIRMVSASGPPTPPGRDPLGPKPKEPPSLANLSVHLTGDEGLPARWSIAPATAQPQGRLTVIGTTGKAVLCMPANGNWSLSVVANGEATESFAPYDEAERHLWQLSQVASAKELYNDSAWLDACRDQEAAEAVDRSLLRGRAIELFQEEHTERDAFKGVMAMGGCLLLVTALAVTLVATVVEGLRLPIRTWILWRAWPVFLLVPIAAFLLLQLFQLAVKRQDKRGGPIVGRQTDKALDEYSG